jgi:hypothetical protein
MTTATQSPEANKAAIAAYVRDLEGRGFCAIDDISANQTRLLNRFDGRKLPMSFLRGDFRTYKRGKDIQGDLPSVEYVAACLPHVVGTKFLPGAGPLYADPTTRMTFANTHRAYQATHDHARVSPFFTEFFERMLCDDERHIVLQYLAHIIQHPYVRPSWHIMIPSDTGTGKGFLLQEILHPLLLHTSVISSFGKLTGQFSSVLEDNLLVLLDDCKARSDATQTQLKSILSEERQYVERKTLQGIAPRQVGTPLVCDIESGTPRESRRDPELHCQAGGLAKRAGLVVRRLQLLSELRPHGLQSQGSSVKSRASRHHRSQPRPVCGLRCGIHSRPSRVHIR